MIEHIEKRRTLYKVCSSGCVYWPWHIKKWRWWLPVWMTHAKFIDERHAHIHLERMQRNDKFYEL